MPNGKNKRPSTGLDSDAKRVKRGAGSEDSSSEGGSDDELPEEVFSSDEEEEEEEEDEGGAVSLSSSASDLSSLDDATRVWITVIDVGQGESTLIRYQEQDGGDWVDLRVILVDGGRAHFAADSIEPTLVALGVERVHAVVCSHYDADHMEGLTAFGATARGNAAHLYERSSAARGDDDKVAALRARYAGRRTQMTLLDPTNEILKSALDDEHRKGAPTLECRAVDNEGALWSEENDYSIALLLKFKKFTFFLGGDLTSEIEDNLGLGHVCALKCGHHGSKHSSSRTFLDELQPRAAFISAASHSYCHPDDETIAKLCATAALQRIYLTNCVYNRGGVNPEFEAKEDMLFATARTRFLAAIDAEDAEAYPVGFIQLKHLRDREDTDAAGFDAMLVTDLELSSTHVRQKYPADAAARKKWNDIARLYYSARDIQVGRRDRAAREHIGDVAGSDGTLGNVHVTTTSAEAADESFTVYYHNAADALVGRVHTRGGVDAQDPLLAPAIPPVARHAATDAPFSLLTGPSAEAHGPVTPQAVDDYGDEVADLRRRVEDGEWDAAVVWAGMGAGPAPGNAFRELYQALKTIHAELQSQHPTYALKVPEDEMNAGLDELEDVDSSGSEFSEIDD